MHLKRSFDAGAGFAGIAGAEHRHIRDGPHQGDILDALVGAAVRPDQYAGVGRTDLDVAVGIGKRIAHLIIGAARRKGGKGACKDRSAKGGHSGGETDQVCLGDSHIDEAFGILLGKMYCLGRLGKIGVHDKEIILSGQLDEGCAVSLTGGIHSAAHPFSAWA